VRLVGPEALPEDDKLLLLVARMIREDFLMQSAYHPVDTYSPPERSHKMLSAIIRFYDVAKEMAESGMLVSEIAQSKLVPRISRMKDIPHDQIDDYVNSLRTDMDKGLAAEEGGI
jgi:V/A-type H+-transporting ATPase subunit A